MKESNKKRINGKNTKELKFSQDDSFPESVEHKTNNLFPIVAIGASAGGLEALEIFFKNMPEKSNIAFVIIQHLDPNRKGMMPEIIQRYTTMEVVHVKDGLKVAPNKIYIIPSNKSMSISKHILRLTEPLETHGLRLPINFFMSSLAEDQQENSIGIILSGMGSDGSMGVQAIKEKSGLVLVQEPSTAKFDSMPRNAINTIPVDIIASVEELPLRLVTFLRNKLIIKSEENQLVKDQGALEKIIILLYTKTGHDFSLYKRNTLYRRIERRMGIFQISKLKDYTTYLQENNAELDILFKDLLIGVTRFFRDETVWEELRRNILPGMFAKLPDNCTFRAWVPGCSTGEEAYSLAIIFKEVLDKLKSIKNISFQIFATDLDTKAIDVARNGIYPESISTYIKASRLNKYFIKTEAGTFRINNEIREMLVFASQNVTKDPPFTKLDFVSCRNMLIYMETELQVKLIKLFHYCLNPLGFLLLGTSESLGISSPLFKIIDSKLKIYQRASKIKPNEPIDFPSSFSYMSSNKIKNSITPKEPESLQILSEQLILQKYAPATILTNAKGDIIFITGKTGSYLEPAAGKANMNIFIMAREGLKYELSIGFRKATRSHKQVVLKNIYVGSNGSAEQIVDITIQRIEKPEALLGMFLFVFNNVPIVVDTNSKKLKKQKNSLDPKLKSMELELIKTKEELQLSLEEKQTSQEELNSANEELQSSNEELQSSNEELTTSKEEMQSLNEELQTVNAELQIKVDDYMNVNNDLKNLFESTNIATLFLDKNLNIRRFTKHTTNILKLIYTDVGRPFTDIVSNLDYPDIAEDAREVLRSLVFIEKDIKTFDDKWYIVRIMPYRTTDDIIDGLVITFNDITKSKILEFKLKEVNRQLNSINKELNSTNEELVKSEDNYRILLKEKELILKEIHHRIKNNMNVIYSILNLQADEDNNVHSKNSLLDAAARVHSMMILYDKLYRSADNNTANIKEYFPSLIEEMLLIFPKFAKVELNSQLKDISVGAHVLSCVGIILNELITNSMKYAFKNRDDGIISISALSEENHIIISYEDDGPGIPEKITNGNPNSFGLLLISTMAAQINGKINMKNENGVKYILEFDV
ncbi:MAG TPA: chemotaxis protein CheB [Ignavibacteriaceae bacterium]|nr:chemotaxis protein CheB [Ignavibacteriaceae bacterium]